MSPKTFARELSRKGGELSLADLSPATAAALEKAGVTRDQLGAIAGKDGVIRGAEFDGLAQAIDRFERSGGAGSGGAQRSERPSEPATLARTELRREVEANRMVARGRESPAAFAARLGKDHGVIDVSHLSEPLRTELSKAGLTTGDLNRIAGADRLIKGSELKTLAKALDASDGAKDGRLVTTVKDAEGNAVPTALGKALTDEVLGNRARPELAQPGSIRAPEQGRTLVATHAEKGGEPTPTVRLKTKGIDQFSLYPDDEAKGGKACFEAAVKQATDHNTKVHGRKAPAMNGAEGAIQVGYSEDKNGRLVVDPERAKMARAYIDHCLEKKLPVVAGVSYEAAGYNHDKLTEHFITIDGRGQDEAGRTFYSFKDPGDGGRSGRLYVDQTTGKLFKEGDYKDGYVANLDYEVTQIRTYAGVDVPSSITVAPPK